MPPKAQAEEKQAPVPDTQPFGIFFNFRVPTARLNFELAAGAEGQEQQTLPDVHLSLTYPGPWAPVVSEPVKTDSEEQGLYKLNFDKAFRQDEGLPALNTLLNTPPVLAIHDSATGAVLASAPIDITPFALGEQQISLTDVLLHPAPRNAAGTGNAGAAGKGASKPTTPQTGTKKGAAPEPAAPAQPELKLRGPVVLSSVTVYLTQRTAPVTAEGEAQPADGTAELPEQVPYRYFTGDDAARSNVITFAILNNTPRPLPQGLLTTNTAAPGKLSITAALSLPPACGEPLVLTGTIGTAAAATSGADGGTPTAEPCVVWQGGEQLKRVMTPTQVQALLDALDSASPSESVCGVEVCRSVGEDKTGADTQTAWDAYHAWAPLPEASYLLEGGVSAVCSVDTAHVTAAPLHLWTGDRPSVLPGFVAPTGKGKPYEDLPVGSPSPWHTSGSVLDVRVCFTRPPVEPWEAPATPQPTLQELIPRRDLHPPVPSPTAPEQLSHTFTHLITQLADAYTAYQSTSDTNNTALMPTALTDGNSSTNPPSVAALHKPFIRQLNQSGQYLAWRDSLKGSLVRLVKEQYGKSGAMAAVEMNKLLSPLHQQLVESATAAIRQARQERPQPATQNSEIPSEEELHHLLHLSSESETIDMDTRRAAALLRRRQRDKDNVQVHIDMAQYNCRNAATQGPSALDAAVTAIRLALEIEPSHPAALVTAAATYTTQALLQQGTATAAAAASSAIAAGHALLQLYPGQPLPWLLLYIAYTAAQDAKSADACMYELKRQQRVMLAAATAAAATAGGGSHADTADAQPAAEPAAADADVTGADEQPAAAAEQPLQPAAAAGVSAAAADEGSLLRTWQWAVELGLTPLATRVMDLAQSALARSVSTHTIPVSVLTARTHLLQAQWAQSSTDQQPEQTPVSTHLDAAYTAAQAARKAIRVWLAAAAAQPDSVSQSDKLRLQITPLLLLGDVEWLRAQAAARAAEAPAGATRQEILARRGELRRQLQQHQGESRRWYQLALQLLHDCGCLQPDASISPVAGLLTDEGRWQGALLASVSACELKRGLLRLAMSYQTHEALPDCAYNVAMAAVSLWRDSAACWRVLAKAASECKDTDTQTHTAALAWTQANTCDRWDGRAWEALATQAFRSGRIEEGTSALRYALSLSQCVAQDTEHSIAVAAEDTSALLQLAARTSAEGPGHLEESARLLKEAQQCATDKSAAFQVHHQLAGVAARLGDVAWARREALTAAQLATTPLQHQQTREMRDQLAAA